METTLFILVVILSSFLAISLLLSIVLLVSLVKLIKSIRRVTQTAEHMVNKAESITDFVAHATTPLQIAKVVSDIAAKFFDKSSKKRKR